MMRGAEHSVRAIKRCILRNIAVRLTHSDIIAHGSHRLHGFFLLVQRALAPRRRRN